jgi:hypothetical protein
LLKDYQEPTKGSKRQFKQAKKFLMAQSFLMTPPYPNNDSPESSKPSASQNHLDSNGVGGGGTSQYSNDGFGFLNDDFINESGSGPINGYSSSSNLNDESDIAADIGNMVMFDKAYRYCVMRYTLCCFQHKITMEKGLTIKNRLKKENQNEIIKIALSQSIPELKAQVHEMKNFIVKRSIDIVPKPSQMWNLDQMTEPLKAMIYATVKGNEEEQKKLGEILDHSESLDYFAAINDIQKKTTERLNFVDREAKHIKTMENMLDIFMEANNTGKSSFDIVEKLIEYYNFNSVMSI